MDDWSRVTLGEVCDLVSGVIRTGPFGSQLHRADYVEDSDGTPVVMPKDIVGGRIVDSSIARVGTETVERLASHRMASGDIVMARRGDIGRRGLVDDRTAGWLCGTGSLRVSLPQSNLDPTFLYYYLGSDEAIGWLQGQAVGATMSNLNTDIVRRLEVPQPPLHVQGKIGAVLAAYDELIENNLRRILILEEMAQAIYREWFVNFRYPGHEADDLIDSPLGPIPKGWEPASLTELADVNAASVQKGSAPAQINYIDISSVSPRSVDAITSLRFEEAPSRARRVVRSGDTIWSTVRPNRRSFALVLDPPEHTIASTGFAVLTPTTVPQSYLYSAVGTLEFSAYLTNHARGAAYPAVNAEDFEKAPLLRPPNGLLGAFHDQTAPMLELVQVLATTNRNLRSTRDLLLPKLVSGDIDVSDLDIDTSWLVA